MTRYREICEDLAGRIGAGELAPGSELPGVRELALRWDTTASTVSRAERALAEAGVIVLADRRRPRVARAGAPAAHRFLHGELVLRVAGSDDPALDLLLRHLGSRVVVVSAKDGSAQGSSAGLRAVRQGRADAAAVHLLHRSGVYNAPFARGLLRGLRPHLVHLWRREQGLLVPTGGAGPGGPGPGGVAELSGRRLGMRRPGTGTRTLQDRLLLDAGLDPDAVRGPVLDSHLEVALAVAAGVVEAGLGVRSAARDLDLDFVSLTWEDYDLVLPGAALDAAAPVIAALREQRVRDEITGLGGYRTGDAGRVTALTG